MFQLHEAPGQDRFFGEKHACFFGMKLDQFSCGTVLPQNLQMFSKNHQKSTNFARNHANRIPKKNTRPKLPKKPSSSRPRFDRSLPVRSGVMSSMRSPPGYDQVNPPWAAPPVFALWVSTQGRKPPKWMVKIMVPNPMNKWMIWGVKTPIFRNTFILR